MDLRGATNGRDFPGAVVVVIEAIKGNDGERGSVIKLAPRFLEHGALACYVLIL